MQKFIYQADAASQYEYEIIHSRTIYWLIISLSSAGMMLRIIDASFSIDDLFDS